MGRALFFGSTQFLSYFLIVANTRAYTQGTYIWTAITDALFASQSWIVGLLWAQIAVEKSEDNSKGWAGVGYVIGGTLGSLASIFVTKLLYGK